MSLDRADISGAGMLLVATIAWGGMFPVAKNALASLDPIYITLIRYASVAVVLLGILMWREGLASLNPEGNAASLFINGSIGFVGFNVLTLYGLRHTQPEKAAIFLALVPLITACIKWLRHGERPTLVMAVCIIVALVGVILVITGGNVWLIVSGQAGWGELAVFGGAVCWSVYTLSRDGLRTWSALRFTCLTIVFGVITLSVLALGATTSGVIPLPTMYILSTVEAELLYLIVVAGVIAVCAWNAGIYRLGAVNGALFMNMVPLTAFAIAIIRGQRPPLAEAIGALLVIGALVTNNLFIRYYQPAPIAARPIG